MVMKIKMSDIKVIALIAFLLISKLLFSQDNHFSQYENTGFIVNPALTGLDDSDWRLINNYRSQWSSVTSPFVSKHIAFERQFYLYDENISGGVFFLNEKSGVLSLNSTKIGLAASYHKKISYNYFHLGVNINYNNKSLNSDNITLPDQFNMNTGYFEGDYPTREIISYEQYSNFTYNIGLIWSKKSDYLVPQAGIAFYNLNQPTESYLLGDERLGVKKVFHGSVKFGISDKSFFKPNIILFNQKNASELFWGIQYGYALNNEINKSQKIFAGFNIRSGFGRNTDAVVFSAGFEYRNVQIHGSYDINISELDKYSGKKGAFELSLIYRGLYTYLEKKDSGCKRY